MAIRTRLALPSDQEALTRFIDDHWARDHVFVKSPELFAWQYLQDGRLNMVMAEEEGGEILGILGFIPLGRFDTALADRDILLAIWKVRTEIAPPGLGLRLLKFIQSELQPRLIGAIGISDIVKPIYKALGYRVAELSHHALFNSEMQGATVVASGVPASAFEPVSGETETDFRLAPLNESDAADVDRLSASCVPAKSMRYLQERYAQHPWYQYQLRAVHGSDGLRAAAVWRPVEAEGSRILRIVDIIGETDWLAQGATLLRPELRAAQAEYIDVMQYGTDSAVLSQGGFVSPADTPDLVLPNYFAPFERRNIPVALAFKHFGGDPDVVRLYRADSDQDRPNTLADLGG